MARAGLSGAKEAPGGSDYRPPTPATPKSESDKAQQSLIRMHLFLPRDFPVSDDARKFLPSMTQVLAHNEVVSLMEQFGVDLVRLKLVTAIDRLRQQLADNVPVVSKIDAENLVIRWLVADMEHFRLQSPRRVINATGVLLHTSLGRAPLADAARRAISEATGACLLEVDPDSGERTYRGFQTDDLLRSLTGCEDSLIVNNNAGATLLLLQALCHGREVVISRGQLVEIGGSFRLPEIFQTAGVILREVGTTNRTHLRDYESAINDRTAAILRVHASNFRIVGFTAEPSTLELARLAQARGVMMFDDIGSGQLFPTPVLDAFHEPDFLTSIEQGSDLVLGSGDKLMGGPQAGIIAGRAPLISTLRHHPLARCLRIDKISLAALHATLLVHARGDAACELPLYQMLQADIATLTARAESIVEQARSSVELTLEIVASVAEVGGGSCAGHQLPSIAIAMRSPNTPPQMLARSLRMSVPGVWGRIEEGALLLDLRSVNPADDQVLVQKLLDMQ